MTNDQWEEAGPSSREWHYGTVPKALRPKGAPRYGRTTDRLISLNNFHRLEHELLSQLELNKNTEMFGGS